MRRTQPPRRRRGGSFAARGTGVGVGSGGSCRCGCNNHTLASQFSRARSAVHDARRQFCFRRSLAGISRTTAGSSPPLSLPHGMSSSSWHRHTPPSASTSTPQRPPRKWVSFWRHPHTGADWLTDNRSTAKNRKRFLNCEKNLRQFLILLLHRTHLSELLSNYISECSSK